MQEYTLAQNRWYGDEPTTISLPFKLMLFVVVDGWSLIMEMLIKSFQT